jgi:hypothetical protein
MMRWLRRLLWLGVLAGGGFTAYRMWGKRQEQSASAPEWPPLSPEPRATAAPSKPTATKAAATPPAAKPTAAKPAATAQARWVPPVDGKCPDGYPLKANDNSRIFHVPGGRFYTRTVAERCYANAEDAIADGYRPAKA